MLIGELLPVFLNMNAFMKKNSLYPPFQISLRRVYFAVALLGLDLLATIAYGQDGNAGAPR